MHLYMIGPLSSFCLRHTSFHFLVGPRPIYLWSQLFALHSPGSHRLQRHNPEPLLYYVSNVWLLELRVSRLSRQLSVALIGWMNAIRKWFPQQAAWGQGQKVNSVDSLPKLELPFSFLQRSTAHTKAVCFHGGAVSGLQPAHWFQIFPNQI